MRRHLTSVLNLWLAARVVKVSGRLKRPWPQLSAMTFPRSIAAAACGCHSLSFCRRAHRHRRRRLRGEPAVAYAVLGLAVLHAITRGMSSRAFLLGGIYAAVIVFGWPVLALCAARPHRDRIRPACARNASGVAAAART